MRRREFGRAAETAPYRIELLPEDMVCLLQILAYLEAYRITGKDKYEDMVRHTADYILRELTDSQGGFYCGQDADSEGVEGKYYVFG